jgi:nitrate/nitrite transporter NarK
MRDQPNGDATEQTPLLQEAGTNLNGSASASGNVPSEEQDDIPDDDSPYLLKMSKTRFWLIFGPILVQYFVAMFDSFLMSSSHPVITSYFHASNAASWLSTSFMLTSTALQPIFGRLSDTIGRRTVYLPALLLFSAATAWCAGAQSIGSFIAGRAVCGIGAGAMMAMVDTSCPSESLHS